jgi:dephospho-CoA kinase
MFHKVLVVYVPEKVQTARLMARDGVTEEEAARRVRAQLSIEEKAGYADFVIHNEGTLAETQKQVDELWGELQRIREGKSLYTGG